MYDGISIWSKIEKNLSALEKSESIGYFSPTRTEDPHNRFNEIIEVVVYPVSLEKAYDIESLNSFVDGLVPESVNSRNYSNTLHDSNIRHFSKGERSLLFGEIVIGELLAKGKSCSLKILPYGSSHDFPNLDNQPNYIEIVPYVNDLSEEMRKRVEETKTTFPSLDRKIVMKVMPEDILAALIYNPHYEELNEITRRKLDKILTEVLKIPIEVYLNGSNREIKNLRWREGRDGSISWETLYRYSEIFRESEEGRSSQEDLYKYSGTFRESEEGRAYLKGLPWRERRKIQKKYTC